ncbi:MAG TPA: hypothetical protein VN810_12695 [Terriglobales bacterium]|nr:hypothetical protein [Terriglobales bacterium]
MPLLCSRCHHDNPEPNRYCGMCGFPLETPPAKAAEAASPDQEAQPARASAGTSILGLNAEPLPPRPAAPRPAITGPSFLGLGTEPASDGASYLLEDDEPRGHRGLWTALVLLVVVALAGWYFRAEARPLAGQLYAAVLARVNPQPPAPAAPAVPAADPASPEPAAAAPQPSSSAAANDAPPAAGVSPDVGPQPAGAATPPSKPDGNGVSAAKEKSAEPAKPDQDATENAAPSKNTGKAAKFAHASRPRPAEAVAPEDNPQLQLAQKYIRGQGVRQDCVTGLAYLREAMKRPNAAAASQMGALYATGTCVALDRLAAYRYFSSALEMSPSNAWLARERDELYGQMSSAERRQADRQ